MSTLFYEIFDAIVFIVIIAAKRAGLTCWAVPNRLSAHGYFSRADKVLSNIGEVVRLLLDDSMPAVSSP
jgi:hypothetical protein